MEEDVATAKKKKGNDDTVESERESLRQTKRLRTLDASTRASRALQQRFVDMANNPADIPPRDSTLKSILKKEIWFVSLFFIYGPKE